MRKIEQVLGLLVLAVSGAGAAQVTTSIQMNKPQKPVVGLPFSADQKVRLEQRLANGTPMVKEVTGHVYRSAAGVLRYDGMMPSTSADHPDPVAMVTILDPAQHTETTLNSRTMTATVEKLPDNATVTIKLLPLPTRFNNQTVKMEKPVTTELGTKQDGMMQLTGARSTAAIPVGAIGNTEPMQATAEVWIARDLKLVVSEREDNPVTGVRTYELTNIRGEEPDAALFEVPAGYKVKEVTLPRLGMPLGLSNLGGSGAKSPEEVTREIDAAEVATSAQMKNSVAYALAQSNERLYDAQMLAEQAVALEEKTTADIVAKGDSPASFHQTVVLSSYWDTLGWVYYREGEQAKAEAFARAAWELKPNVEYGLHLGNIYEAESRTKDAVAIYRMSLSMTTQGDWHDKFEARLAKLGAADAASLPVEIEIPLPGISVGGKGAGVDVEVSVLVGGGHDPVVSFARDAPAHAKQMTQAIQAALAKSLPDSGPETILRAGVLSCAEGKGAVCTLQFTTPDKAGELVQPVKL